MISITFVVESLSCDSMQPGKYLPISTKNISLYPVPKRVDQTADKQQSSQNIKCNLNCGLKLLNCDTVQSIDSYLRLCRPTPSL
jgi:hypothetical protein